LYHFFRLSQPARSPPDAFLISMPDSTGRPSSEKMKIEIKRLQ
jgi:hypothetical protein